jgi:diketogulonate reductase-like aldo/keto reductase
MQEVILNNGVKMPVFGFGVQQMEDAYECEGVVIEGIQTGYRMLDLATGANETAVGRAIRNSGIARRELFIAAKLEATGYVQARRAFELTLCRLGLDYLDLYLLQPGDDIEGAWQAMEELCKAGRIRAIGVSNFQADLVSDLVKGSEIFPAINQVAIQSNEDNKMQLQSSNLPMRLGEDGIEFYGYSIVMSPRRSVAVSKRTIPDRMGKLILTVRNSMQQFGHSICPGSGGVTC